MMKLVFILMVSYAEGPMICDPICSAQAWTPETAISAHDDLTACQIALGAKLEHSYGSMRGRCIPSHTDEAK